MCKKRSIGSINYNVYAGFREVSFVRRSKTGKAQVRKSRLSEQQVHDLLHRVNDNALQRKGTIYVWSTGWSFYPDIKE